MTATVRKRASKNNEDPKIKNIGSLDDNAKSAHGQSDKCFWALVLIGVLLFLYHFTVPVSIKRSHKKAMERHIEYVANAIEEQQQSLAKQYDSLSSQLNEKLGLAWMYEDRDTGGSSLMQQKLQDSEASVATLQEEIAKLRKGMEKIEEKMAFDQDSFCGDCIGNFEGGKLHVKCSERRDWLMEAHNHPKEVATEAVEKIDPHNCRKDHQIDGTFCEECTGSFSEGKLRVKCGQRREHLMSKYGDSKEKATEAVVAMDPIKCVTKDNQDLSYDGAFCEECTGSFSEGKLRIGCGKRRKHLMSKNGVTKEKATEAVKTEDPVNCLTKEH